MTYSPNIFSTKAGLSRTIVFQWIEENDASTIDRWLAEGEKHPRLAEEGIQQAVYSEKLDLADKIWAANWHSPNKTFHGIWGAIESKYYHYYRQAEKDPQLNDRQHLDVLVNWALSKSAATQTNTPLKSRNVGLIWGLQAAFRRNDEQLWDRIVALSPKLDGSEGTELFLTLLRELSVWPNPYSHPRKSAPEWAEKRALSDMLDLGLRPGGSVWVAAAINPDSGPFLDMLLPRAGKLTTARQRAAILAFAQDRKAHRLESLIDTFLPLGVPATFGLTPSEAKKGEQYYEGIYLKDRNYESNLVKLDRFSELRVLQHSTVSLLKSCPTWSKIVRSKLIELSENVRGEIVVPAPPKPKI